MDVGIPGQLPGQAVADGEGHGGPAEGKKQDANGGSPARGDANAVGKSVSSMSLGGVGVDPGLGGARVELGNTDPTLVVGVGRRIRRAAAGEVL